MAQGNISVGLGVVWAGFALGCIIGPDPAFDEPQGSSGVEPTEDGGTASGSPVEGGESTSADIPAEVCDGIDNDLDGLVDERWEPETWCNGCYLDVRGDSAYMLCVGPERPLLPWLGASSACAEDFGAQLVKLEDQPENDYLATLLLSITSQRVWIGANDMGAEGTWIWPDGSIVWQDGAAQAYWAGRGPDNCAPQSCDEDCGEIEEGSFVWNDLQCHLEQAYVCEGDV